MDDPADHAPVVLPLDTAHIRRQMRFYPFPLLIAQPKQVLAHDPDPQTNQTVWNQDCLPAAAKLMSSGPSSPTRHHRSHGSDILSEQHDDQAG
jgi:hypothetical protein